MKRSGKTTQPETVRTAGDRPAVDTSAAAIVAARRALRRLDPILARADDVTPPFEWRAKTQGFAALAHLIVEQQVSIASAKAIWDRLETGLGALDVDQVLARTVDQLKGFGLSTQKARYIRGIAEAIDQGQLDLAELAALDDETACEKLTAFKGVGRWTAEAYLMGCHARLDVFPAGDIALQEAVRLLDGAEARLAVKDLYARSDMWRPYRSIAAHLLWGFYRSTKTATTGDKPRATKNQTIATVRSTKRPSTKRPVAKRSHKTATPKQGRLNTPKLSAGSTGT